MLARLSVAAKSIAVLVLGSILLGVIVWRSGELTTGPAPWGIVSLELAGSEVRAAQIIQSWKERFGGSLAPAFADLLIDCVLFIPLYVAFFGLGCLWAKDKSSTNIGGATNSFIGRFLTCLAWLQFAAAGLDYIENGAMWVMLSGSVVQPWPLVAALCAAGKFVLILAALPYAAMGFVHGLRHSGMWLFKARSSSNFETRG